MYAKTCRSAIFILKSAKGHKCRKDKFGVIWKKIHKIFYFWEGHYYIAEIKTNILCLNCKFTCQIVVFWPICTTLASKSPCRNETQILRFRAVGYYDSPMGSYYGARYQVSSPVHFFLKHLSKKICSRCSRRRYKEPFRATHVCSCVVVIANTSRDRRIRAEIWRSNI